jgi:uncharacterized protein with ParB-like and HNH nuclease domain
LQFTCGNEVHPKDEEYYNERGRLEEGGKTVKIGEIFNEHFINSLIERERASVKDIHQQEIENLKAEHAKTAKELEAKSLKIENELNNLQEELEKEKKASAESLELKE